MMMNLMMTTTMMMMMMMLMVMMTMLMMRSWGAGGADSPLMNKLRQMVCAPRTGFCDSNSCIPSWLKRELILISLTFSKGEQRGHQY
jgi:hypothetical protein